MTVVAVGRVHGIAGGRTQLLDLMRRTTEAARAEPGCRAYDFAEVVGGVDEFLVVHEWDDQAALDAHYGGAVHAAYREGVFGLLARPSELVIHQVAATERPIDTDPMDPREAD
jgi:quinol monooxygenase YgiN